MSSDVGVGRRVTPNDRNSYPFSPHGTPLSLYSSHPGRRVEWGERNLCVRMLLWGNLFTQTDSWINARLPKKREGKPQGAFFSC